MKHRSILDKLKETHEVEEDNSKKIVNARELLVGMNLEYFADVRCEEDVKLVAATLRNIADRLSKFDTKHHKKFAEEVVRGFLSEMDNEIIH